MLPIAYVFFRNVNIVLLYVIRMSAVLENNTSKGLVLKGLLIYG